MAKPSNDPSNYIGMALQTAKDAEQGSQFFFFKHLEGSGFEVEPDIETEREGGDGQEAGLRYKTKITSDGAVVSNARPGVTGRLPAFALGQDTVASIAANLHDHTAFPAASLPYLTTEQRAPEDLIERTTNNMYTGLTWEWEAGKPLKLNGAFMCGGSIALRDSASALTVTRETAKPFQYPGASVLFAVNDGIGGGQATSIVVTKGKVEVKRGVDDDIQTTSLTREDVVPLTFDVDVDCTLRYEDRNLYKRVFYGGGSQIVTELATGSLKLFSARGSFFHGLNLPLLDVTGAKLNRLDPDGKTVYVDVAAMSIKNATHSIWTLTRTTDATGYLVPPS